MQNRVSNTKAAIVGAAFGVGALVIRSIFTNDQIPNPYLPYLGGGAIAGALMGVAYAAIKNR